MSSDMRVFVKNMRGEALMPCSTRMAQILFKHGKAEIAEFVFGRYEVVEKNSPSRLNEVQQLLVKHIAYTFRRLLKQRDEGWGDSFLMMRAGFYCDAIIDDFSPGGSDKDTLVRMLKNGSTDEEIMKWYMGDIVLAI